MIVDTDKLESDQAYREDMRARFERDHFFAAELLGFHKFNRRAHGPVFNGLYFPKNRNLPIREQSRKHKRLHLDPRHSFKTIAKRIDRIQWIAAFPEEMTCLVESATQPLAEASAEKSGLVFYRPKGRSPHPLHLMYPELVTEKYPKPPWNISLRRQSGEGDMDFTLDFTSPKTQQSGWHPILIEPDDVEDVNNSGIGVNADVRQHVIDVCDQNENLLQDGGFINVAGTRYHPFDWYGKLVERANENPDSWEILIRCSITRNDGERLLPGEFPDEDDCELIFPELPNLSYEELREKFFTNYESFMGQQQNDPQGGAITRFNEKIYDSNHIEPKRIPRDGETYICWRPRYGAKKNMARYSEGACCRIVDGRIFVLDAWQGTYTASGEAEKIVFQCKQHEVDGLMLLDIPGSEYLTSHIRNEAARKNRSVKIQWTEWDEDDARRNAAIEQLEPLMKVGRVQFSTAMMKARECRKQFINFGLVEENGIIECIAKFADLVPLSVMRANMHEQELEWSRQRRDDAMLSQFLDQQGLDAADEEVRMQTEAHLDAMAKTVNQPWPRLPGGLDG